MKQQVNKAKPWTCVEIAVRDVSALPGQSTIMPIAVLARRGNDVRHIPLRGAEGNSKQETLSEMAANAVNNEDGAGLFEYVYMRGIGAYSSCSEEFLIEAKGWDELMVELGQRGFPPSPEVI
tara:strand:+ start:765 stop:1130 length:366 start_codon:yes stop_codon:yes gene_type:complete